MKHGFITRVIHLGVAAAILFQLASSLLMEAPRPDRLVAGLPLTSFNLHETLGLVAVAIILVFWLWLLVRRGETRLGVLFPWFSRTRLAALGNDVLLHLKAARRFSLPEPEDALALAGAIQGIGLIAALVMAVTGFILYFAWTPGTVLAGAARDVFVAHALMAKVMWTYLILHVGAAVAHELLGQRILHQMSLRPQGAPAMARAGRPPRRR